MIKNLSQLKNQLKVGDSLRIEYENANAFQRATLNGTTRKIIKKQSNAIQFENGSWLFWQKASRYSFFNGGFSVYWDDEKQNKIMDYYFV